MIETIYLKMREALEIETEKQNLMTEEISAKFRMWDAAFENKDWATCNSLIDEIGKIVGA